MFFNLAWRNSNGFAKYKIKDCGYMGVVFAHGLYDFLNTVVRMFIV